LIFCTTFVWNISHSKQKWARHCQYHQCTVHISVGLLHVKYRLFLSDIYDTRNFLTVFQKYTNTKFHKNPSSGVELLRADGRTDMMKLIVAFRNFAKAYKNCRYKNYCCTLSFHGTSSSWGQQLTIWRRRASLSIAPERPEQPDFCLCSKPE
jgi:hypothetical protein